MRNIQMIPRPHYPYSDLTAEQIEHYLQAARKERALAARSLFLALGRAVLRGAMWLRRRREAQVWRPTNEPHVSPTVYS